MDPRKTQGPVQRPARPPAPLSVVPDQTGPRYPETPDKVSRPLPSPQVVQATLLYLMNRYARTGCPRLLTLVLHHLHLLSSHPQLQDDDGVLRRMCDQLVEEWSDMVVRS